MAIHTGIAPSVWAAEGARAVATAYDVFDDERMAAEAKGR